jgi:hypothetical protein
VTGWRIEDTDVVVFGSGDRLSPAVSAYAALAPSLPEFVFFGVAAGEFDPPGALEGMRLRTP